MHGSKALQNVKQMHLFASSLAEILQHVYPRSFLDQLADLVKSPLPQLPQTKALARGAHADRGRARGQVLSGLPASTARHD